MRMNCPSIAMLRLRMRRSRFDLGMARDWTYGNMGEIEMVGLVVGTGLGISLVQRGIDSKWRWKLIRYDCVFLFIGFGLL